MRFEVDRFELAGNRGLELRGRWFGIRGRRFVRPTLTMRIDGEKHRLLADLEHKPWGAEEGEEWVALFSPAPPPGEAEEIELAVARDIAISLSPPGLRAPSATLKRSAVSAGGSPRPASSRKSQPDRARRALEQERARARDLGNEIEELRAERDRLTAERDALIAARDGLTGDRDAVIAERDALIAERDSIRRAHALSRKRLAEQKEQLRTLRASASTSLSEGKAKLEAQRVEVDRLRSALELREAVIADRDRLAHDLDAAVAERDRLAAHASQPHPVVRTGAPPAPQAAPVRPVIRAGASRRRGPAWIVRALAIIALGSVLLALVIILHLV